MNFYIFVDTDKNTLQNMLTFLSRFFKEADEAAEERLKMPIVPLYLSLLAFSYWRPLSIFLLSKNTIEEKISLIDKLYVNWTFLDHIWVVISMLLLASLSSAIFPVLMWLLDWLLLQPNSKRKNLNIESKKIDRVGDLESTQHRYEINKILSGNKEVEDYNKSIEDLKKSYEDRIKSLETVSLQKQQNWEKDRAILEEQNKQISSANNELLVKQLTLERRMEELVVNDLFISEGETSVPADVKAYSYFINDEAKLKTIVKERMLIGSLPSQEVEFIIDVVKATNVLFYQKLRAVLFSNQINRLTIDLHSEEGKLMEKIIVKYKIGYETQRNGSSVEYRIIESSRLIHSLYNFLKSAAPMLPNF